MTTSSREGGRKVVAKRERERERERVWSVRAFLKKESARKRDRESACYVPKKTE